MRSRCPLCIGSNIPGYTARLPTGPPSECRDRAKKPGSVYAPRERKSRWSRRIGAPSRARARPAASGGGALVACWSTTTAPACRHGAAARARRGRARRAASRTADRGRRRAKRASRRASSSTRARRVRRGPRARGRRGAGARCCRAARAAASAVLLDEHRRRRAARERLDPHPARPREEIEEGAVGQIRHQRVEAGDAHVVRGGPRRRPARRGEPLALQLPREHPHAITGARMVRERNTRATGGSGGAGGETRLER